MPCLYMVVYNSPSLLSYGVTRTPPYKKIYLPSQDYITTQPGRQNTICLNFFGMSIFARDMAFIFDYKNSIEYYSFASLLDFP